ncbi:ABC transporter permease [Paenibacillus sacheonensis]|uniref:ABC transporter permease subunit n=1 Tax=Paenibacillus sacheonensis TaxID=742054 RepID=A0A7X4YP68_9BACL|nr:ABC transporter permease subunit [Paenibacillus sacheonensis]MBM7565306.1 ABC-2 type transport system permease protein [Paenibacillus sacheonensis]NBC69923.1 ABC transporter permease subunit [Paenibacillus sacheonensis]
MRQWTVMYRKEWLELLRTYKLLWVPLAFVLLSAMQPVSTYFLPDILAHAGNLPEGAVISIPVPTAEEVMAQTLQQLNVFGLLILALSSMNVISAERTGGMTAMILVKPVSFRGFVASKWAAQLTLVTIAFAGGFGAAYYYTSVLFRTPDWHRSLIAIALYWLWLVLAGALTLAFSALLRSGAAAAVCSLALLAALSVTAGLLPDALSASPGMLPKLASAQFLDPAAGKFWPVTVSTLGVLAAAMETAAFALRKRPTLLSS